MQPDLLAKIFGAKLNRFGQKWLDLGNIKILHPQKHSISYGYANKPELYAEVSNSHLLFDDNHYTHRDIVIMLFISENRQYNVNIFIKILSHLMILLEPRTQILKIKNITVEF